jgi:hypothetical protein
LHDGKNIAADLRMSATAIFKKEGHHAANPREIRSIEDLTLDPPGGNEVGPFKRGDVE